MVRRALIFFPLSLALGLGGLYLVFGGALFRAETYRAENFGVSLLLLVLAAFLTRWLLHAARIWLLCRGQGMPLSYGPALLVHLGAMFVAAATPSSAGLAPATAAALRRLGLPLGRGIGVAVQVILLDLFFFAWAVPAGLGYLVVSGVLRLPPVASTVALAAALLGLVAAAVLSRRPRLVVALILALARLPVLRRLADRLRRVAQDYHRGSRAFLRTSLPRWIALHAVSAGGWLGSFLLLWALLQLYDVPADLPATLAILAIVTLAANFFPTPGGAGFIEAAVGFGVAPDGTPNGNAAAALLLWRLGSFYVVFLLGPLAGWLLYRARPILGRDGKASRNRGDTP